MQIYWFLKEARFNNTYRFLKIVFVFVSPYETNDVEFGQHLIKHGDGVKDISFEVEDLDAIVKRARERGATVLKDIWEETDEFGTTRFAMLKTVKLLPEKKIFHFKLINFSINSYVVRRYNAYSCGSEQL